MVDRVSMDGAAGPTLPSARIGTPALSLLVAASMIGAGVYTTSGFSLAAIGSRPLVLLAWAIAGGIALCGAVSYGQLA